jgi:uncharacterized membrane protein YeaQ/YmgE (transglycosylase-associated protein family)
MIYAAMLMVAVGLLAGIISDELLRGRDPRAGRVVVAGLVGAIVGLNLRRASGNDGLVIGTLSALVGALVLAFIVRARLSAATARLTRWA